MFVVLTQCHWPEMAIVGLGESGNLVFESEDKALWWAERTQAFPFIIVDLDKAISP